MPAITGTLPSKRREVLIMKDPNPSDNNPAHTEKQLAATVELLLGKSLRPARIVASPRNAAVARRFALMFGHGVVAASTYEVLDHLYRARLAPEKPTKNEVFQIVAQELEKGGRRIILMTNDPEAALSFWTGRFEADVRLMPFQWVAVFLDHHHNFIPGGTAPLGDVDRPLPMEFEEIAREATSP